MTLKELSVDHPYYCSESNFYSNECTFQYENWDGFWQEMGDADPHMNLLFRWDIHEHEDAPGTYRMDLFFMHQRKGRFICNQIASIQETDVPAIVNYLTDSYQHLQKLWEPVSSK